MKIKRCIIFYFLQLLQGIIILRQRNITIGLPVITFRITGIQLNGLIGILDRQSVVLHLDMREGPIGQINRGLGSTGAGLQGLGVVLDGQLVVAC